jgi:hypothetical protein
MPPERAYFSGNGEGNISKSVDCSQYLQLRITAFYTTEDGGLSGAQAAEDSLAERMAAIWTTRGRPEGQAGSSSVAAAAGAHDARSPRSL